MKNSFQNTKEFIEQQHTLGRRVALVKGVFDLLHPEHTEYLKKCKQVADVLVVLIIRDEITQKLKPGRPIQDEQCRKAVISAIKSVDFAEIDYDSTDVETGEYSKTVDITKLKELNPDIWIVTVGRKIKYTDTDPIEIVEISTGTQYSTTNIINKVLETYADEFVKSKQDL
ncbi:hypothetical protein CO112_00290 [Candidatus Dojkabacteria bacterium CG_4_9_14_3_um_filter_150_Dojkabacteria_WS6_41_13]|nr:MAG: hypothetical protein CO112_00290 [Candidatus Dojkabacteria bacterium CG_4_9_14_3_um_filter_150_Dojkabacteria_WS6_41_13]